MKALIILLNRTGDIVQASPLFASLQSQGLEVHILGLPGFLEICRCIPSITKIFVMRGKDWKEVVDSLNGEGYDLVVNLTPTAQSAALITFIHARQKRGLGLAMDGGLVSWGRWANYYLSVARNKDLNLYNIVDMFMGVAGCHKPVHGPTLVPDPEVILNDLPDRFIVVAPGASTPDRCWPIERYAELCDSLSRTHDCEIVLLGTEKERTMGELISERLGDRARNLIGKTNIVQAVSIVDRSNLTVGNDSAPVHIAARLDKPAVCLSLSPANYWSTGPYGKSTFVLQSKDLDLPEVEQVLDVAGIALGGRRHIHKGAEVARSALTETGYLTYRLIIKKPLELHRFLAYVVQHTSPIYLFSDDLVPIDAVVKVLQEDYLINDDFAFGLDHAMTGYGLLGDLFDEMYRICKVMESLAEDRKNIPQLRRLKAGVDRIDKSMESIAIEYPLTSLILGVFYATRNGIESQDVKYLAAYYVYWAKVFAEWSRVIDKMSRSIAHELVRG